MFIDESIPQSYKYIAEISDNYVVLVENSTLNNNYTYNAYYQFFYPSTQVLFVDDYKIKNGDIISYDFNYVSDNFYNYIDSIDKNIVLHCNELEETRDNDANLFNRADISNVGLLVALFLCLYILIWNLASALVHRGGIFK